MDIAGATARAGESDRMKKNSPSGKFASFWKPDKSCVVTFERASCDPPASRPAMSASPAMAASSAMARVLPGRTTRGRVGGVGLRGESYASDSGNDAPRFEKHGTRGHGFSSSVPAFGASPTRPRPRSRRARVIRTAATSSSGDKNGGWLRPLEGLAQRMGVTIYQAPVPPAVVPGSRADFLAAMLQWHLQNSTSVDLVMREVSESILSEIQSFPVDKVAIGESPSVAMHVPIPILRANPNGPPASLSAMGARSMKQSKGAGTAPNESTLTQKEKGSPYDTGADDQGGPLQSFPSWDGWTQPTTALTLRAVLMTAGALSAAAGMRPAGGTAGRAFPNPTHTGYGPWSSALLVIYVDRDALPVLVTFTM